MGLPEGLGSTPGVLDGFLRYILDLNDDELTPEVENQRRAPRPLPDPGEPPCPYIVCILR